MPTTGNFGNYIAEGTAGDQVSSTYEGRYVTVTAAELLTSAGSGVATKGLPCVFGLMALQGVGVCLNTGTLTDLIAIDTEGIWDLLVSADDEQGTSAVTGGDPLYINNTSGIISKLKNAPTQIPFGYALGIITAGANVVIPVKVHWAPQCNWLLDQEILFFGDDRDVSIEWNETFLAIAVAAVSKAIGLEMAISAAALADGYGFFEVNANVSGAATAFVAADSTWINLAADFVVMAGGGLITPHTDGIYQPVAASITGATVALAGKFTDQMAGADFGMFNIWNFNLTQTVTAMMEINNPALMGYIAGTDVANVCGSIPFFHTGGGATKYIRLYSDAAA